MSNIYCIDDFIYRATCSRLYNMSGRLITDLGSCDYYGNNPHSKRATSYLYYRPRVEELCISRRQAYEQAIGMRLRRMNDRDADDYDQVMTQIEAGFTIAPVLPIGSLELIFAHMRGVRSRIELRIHDRKTNFEDWTPDPADLFHYVLYACTNYNDQLNEFWNMPGAGLAFLALRDVATPVVLELMEELAAGGDFSRWQTATFLC